MTNQSCKMALPWRPVWSTYEKWMLCSKTTGHRKYFNRRRGAVLKIFARGWLETFVKTRYLTLKANVRVVAAIKGRVGARLPAVRSLCSVVLMREDLSRYSSTPRLQWGSRGWQWVEARSLSRHCQPDQGGLCVTPRLQLFVCWPPLHRARLWFGGILHKKHRTPRSLFVSDVCSCDEFGCSRSQNSW